MKLIKKLTFLIASVAIVLGASCKKTTQEPNPPTPPSPEFSGVVVLKASSNTLKPGEVCTFTVTADGKDVTSESQIFKSDKTALGSKDFKSDETGSFTFYAVYKDKESEKIVVNVVSDVYPGEVKLSVDNPEIVANGNRKSTFKVEAEGEDITNQSSIYNEDGSQLNGNVFTTETPGTYNFYAIYKGKKSNTVTINATKEAEISIPEDSQPNNFEFKSKVLALKFTGTLCPACPYATRVVRWIEKEEKYKDKILFAEIHAYKEDNKLYTKKMATYSYGMGITGFPDIRCNFRDGGFYDKYQQYGDHQSMIIQMINDNYTEKADAGIATSVKLDGNKIIADVAIKVGKDDSYRVGAFLMEDGVIAQQAGGFDASYNTHNNAVREVYGNQSNTDFTGEDLAIKAGETKKMRIEFDVNSKWKGENCKVLVYVTTPDGKKYYAINAIVCKVNEEVAFQYTK